jgi:hypothetical protein
LLPVFVSDWVDSLIGPSGLLLLVVSNQLVSILVSSFMVEVGKKVRKYNLDVRNMFAESHTESCWWWKWLQIVSATKRPAILFYEHHDFTSFLMFSLSFSLSLSLSLSLFLSFQIEEGMVSSKM